MPRRMLEGELESAICKAYSILLPDLHAAGFRIKSQQAILLGRRIDLLLEAEDGSVCIIELKAGAPPMPHVRDQILDYKACWAKSYPNSKQPRLLVIGNSIPDATKAELANFGVESRAISLSEVSGALRRCEDKNEVVSGLKLAPDDDLATVRHLLSDYDAVAIPDGMIFRQPWSHEKVFLALVHRGEKHKELWKKNICVHVYTRRPGCAVLYGPRVENTKAAPLHLNPRRSTWDKTAFRRMKSYIDLVTSDHKGPGRENSNFDHYRIKPDKWDDFADAIGL